MEEVKKEAEEIKENIKEKSFAMELILNARNDAKRWFIVAMTILFMWLVTIAGFLLYLNQYDYTSTQSYEANGIYALIDSEGNMIAQDISQETWDKFTEWWKVYGEGKSNDNEGAN